MSINIVMYHYVRNNEEYDYDTFCRRKNEFESQIEFFQKTSSIVNCNDLEKIKYFLKNDHETCYLLTFDDGYKDHLYCANYLYEKNINAYFFPPSNVLSGDILDVNAIHMLIGKKGIDIKKLLQILYELCSSSNYKLSLNNKKIDINSYLENFDIQDNYDDRNTLIFKRILQRDLIGANNRKIIIDILLKKFISKQPSEISSELYLNGDDLEKMKKMGMVFGSHGKTHRWLNTLNYFEQKKEIEESFKELRENKLISDNEPIAMCYPYGGYDLNTIKIMSNLNVDIGFSTEIGHAKSKVEKEFIFKLPRWDTNHFWDNKWRRPTGLD